MNPETHVAGIDFRAFTDEGFLFTPYRYDGPFESVGLLQITVWAEADLEPVQKSDKANRSGTMRPEWKFRSLDIQDVLTTAYTRAREMDADAIVDLEIATKRRPIENSIQTQPGIELTGYAVRRRGEPEQR